MVKRHFSVWMLVQCNNGDLIAESLTVPVDGVGPPVGVDRQSWIAPPRRPNAFVERAAISL
jgi:hypothetical protein